MITKNNWNLSKEHFIDNSTHFYVVGIVIGLYYPKYVPFKAQKEYEELKEEEKEYIKKRYEERKRK